MKREMLLVVDVQNGFVKEGTVFVVPRILSLLDQNRFEIVAFTQFYNPSGGPYERFLDWTNLSTSSEQEIVASLRNYAQLVFRKSVYSALTQDFRSFLKEKKIETVHLAGIDTDCCILSTAIDLFQIGIRPVVLIDLCASNGGAESHAAALRVMERAIGCKQIVKGSDF